VRLRLTKGAHLVIDRQRLPVPDAVVMADGPRILFAIPWGERVILGTTDTDYDGPLDDVRAEPADVACILRVTNAAFPAARLSDADVIGTWAGLRPLIASNRGGPSDISRAHQIAMPEPGWLDVAGGKLTTYRLIAEQAVDRLLRHLGRPCCPCRTADEPLLSGCPRITLECCGAAVPAARAGETPAPQVILGHPPSSTASGILPPPVSRELVEHYCRHEWAVCVDDIMLRRTGWRHYRTDADEIARQVGQWMTQFC